ncbi:TPA: hemerythrin domain-containing protein, partial [Candidatus Bathyarchaeota archaeon]|nr:hemerythrin domain-containing protein [Candidatus Bathyarchaeota archaeon]
MERAENWVDPLKRLIKDHNGVSEYMEHLEGILGFLYEEQAWRKMKPIEDFFKRNVIGHFEFEEKMVFPPILLGHATPEAIKLILELQREHGSILKELEEFQKIISEKVFPLDEETYERLNVMGRRIIDSLLGHASKEDDKLLPILRKNSRIFDRQ